MNNEVAVTLSAALNRLRYHEVRAIMAALGLGRRATENQKADWVAAIAAAWLNPAQQSVFLDRLSPAAQAALWRLLPGGELPCALFLADYGAIRLPGAADAAIVPDSSAPPPWRRPQTISEELFYAGLLLPGADQSILETSQLQLPWELRRALDQPLTERLGFTALNRLPPDPLPAQPPLLHDLAQWLIYLHQQRDLVLLHGRWLPPHHLQALNDRLLRPEQSRPLPSHKRTRWPAFLSFLAAAAELATAGQVTAAGWHWLAADQAQQLRILWEAWCMADQGLRLAYNQPAAGLPAPWPLLVFAYLEETFAPAWLTNVMLAMETQWHGYFVAHLPSLRALDEETAALLAVLLHDFDAIAPAHAIDDRQLPAHPSGIGLTAATLLTGAFPGDGPLAPYDQLPYAQIAYQLTALGRWLLNLPGAKSPQRRWQRRRPPPAHLTETPDTFTLNLPVDAAPLAQAQLAPFALVEQGATPPTAVVDSGVHCYTVNAATVGQAAAAHIGLPTLLTAFGALQISLDPDQLARLHAWYAAGQRLQLTLLPLLRTTDATLMAQLQQNRALHPWLGEVLNPTTAVWQGEANALLAVLRQQGFYPDATALMQAAAVAASSAAPAPEAGALWLAMRTYQLLGHFLPLPFALPAEQVRVLEQALSPVQQAALQAHLAQIEARLRQVLDHLPFTPPPFPTDPAQWRPLIAAAIAAQQTLQMTYFSAGRNLSTQRLVEPYWIEEHQGIPYLRAYCHSAERVLTFRLDRIQLLVGESAVGESAVRSPES